MDKDLNIFENLEPKEEKPSKDVTYTGVDERDVNWKELGYHKVGDIVEIIGNSVGHGFQIGERVRVQTLDEHGFIYYATGVKDGVRWAIYDTEVKRIQK